jgi:hypothetical protein
MRRSFADPATIRAAIFDVIEAGDQDGTAWLLAQDESDEESERRCRFADQVVSMIEDLQSNFKFTKLENLCPTHIREAIPRPTSQVCVECEKKQKAVGA